MKSIFTLSFLSLMLFQITDVLAQSATTIEFQTLEHDFGKIKEDSGPAIFNFSFKNTGQVPLIISSVNASCGCTTPEWSKEPVLPGKGGFIKVAYNPLNRPGAFNKTISVVANIQQGTVVLKISGDVLQKTLTLEEQYPSDLGKIRFLTNNLSFVRIKNNEVKKDSLKFINPGVAPIKIGFKGVAAFLNVKTLPETIQPKQTGYFVVSYDGTKANEFGFQMTRVYLTYNGEENYNYGINITATIEEDFSKLSTQEIANGPIIDFDTRAFEFGEVTEGTKVEHTFVLMNKGKSDLNIRSVKASCGCTAANPTSNVIKPGQSTELKTVFDSKGKLGLQNKTITIISNDPNQATTILRISGNVINAK